MMGQSNKTLGFSRLARRNGACPCAEAGSSGRRWRCPRIVSGRQTSAVRHSSLCRRLLLCRDKAPPVAGRVPPHQWLLPVSCSSVGRVLIRIAMSSFIYVEAHDVSHDPVVHFFGCRHLKSLGQEVVLAGSIVRRDGCKDMLCVVLFGKAGCPVYEVPLQVLSAPRFVDDNRIESHGVGRRNAEFRGKISVAQTVLQRAESPVVVIQAFVEKIQLAFEVVRRRTCIGRRERFVASPPCPRSPFSCA